MDHAEFINAYIKKLVDEVGEAAKARILLTAQLEYTAKQLETLLELTQELKNENEELKKTIEEQRLVPEVTVEEPILAVKNKKNTKKNSEDDF